MKPHARLAAVVGLAVVYLLVSPTALRTQVRGPKEEGQGHYKWLVERMQEADSVSVGMSRADLLKVFEPDGGLNRIPPVRYVLRSCPLIKVDVQFEISRERYLSQRPADTELKITAISKPYLESPIME